MRKNIVAGNWKMNNNLSDGLKLTSEIVNTVANEVVDNVDVVIAAPFIHLSQVTSLTQEAENISVAAQNCSEHASGAYTGEISAEMVSSTGAAYVILGHSERREYFSETNAQLAAKVDKALEHNLTPIFCCGESLEVRENGDFISFVANQIKESLFHLSEDDFAKIVIVLCDRVC